VNRLMDQALCVAEEQAVAQVAEAAGFGEVQKLQVGWGLGLYVWLGMGEVVKGF